MYTLYRATTIKDSLLALTLRSMDAIKCVNIACIRGMVHDSAHYIGGVSYLNKEQLFPKYPNQKKKDNKIKTNKKHIKL